MLKNAVSPEQGIPRIQEEQVYLISHSGCNQATFFLRGK